MDCPIKKNEEYIVEIVDNGYEGEGIAKIQDYIVFIPNTIKGEMIKVRIIKVLSSYAYGKAVQIIKRSSYRIQEECNSYVQCGGCCLRHMQYEQTLQIKQANIQQLVDKTLKQKIIIEPVIGMGNPYFYRNKAQYPVGQDNEGKPIVGIYAKRSHRIIPLQNCKIQEPVTEKIAKEILKWMKENSVPGYNEEKQTGIIRHIVIKVAKQTKQIMCILVINQKKLPKEKELVERLIKEFPDIKTIVKNVNCKNTNVILGEENSTLYGEGYIYDKLGEYTFKISPLSFYQVNSIQAEALYYTAIEMAEVKEGSNKIAFDLYCGIGTITLFLSNYFKTVYGIEIVKQAIEDAKENAKLNDITNTEFIAGDVEQVVTKLIQEKKIKPDVIFVDPPRKGLDNTTIQNILKVKPEKIVYISCNPSTLVRDLEKIQENYEVKKIQPVDMFPYTSHVECVAMLQLKQDR